MRLIALLLACLAAGPALAGEARIAVAANFAEPAREIAAAFAAATGHKAILSFGASGTFAAQIRQGAPFEAFLSADEERPKALLAEGLAQRRFAYAVGRLVLWSRDAAAAPGEARLRAGDFAKLAIANPAAAPYGGAAVETMAALGLTDALKPKLVEGASIAQAFQFVETGNAELGFVARSQILGRGGAAWLVPQTLHAPIRQDAALLTSGAGNAAAGAFLDFLNGPQARAIVEKFGYESPGG